jgi:small subunit ribosomal protein S25e
LQPPKAAGGKGGKDTTATKQKASKEGGGGKAKKKVRTAWFVHSYYVCCCIFFVFSVCVHVSYVIVTMAIRLWMTSRIFSEDFAQSWYEQKWSKGKQKEKVNAAVFFDKNLYEKLKKEVPSYKLITPSIISERMKCNVSMARRALRDLELKGMIRPICRHASQVLYTRALSGSE